MYLWPGLPCIPRRMNTQVDLQNPTFICPALLITRQEFSLPNSHFPPPGLAVHGSCHLFIILYFSILLHSTLMYNIKLRRKCNPLFQFFVLRLLHYMFRPQSAIIRCITYVVATLHTIQNLKTADFAIVLVASSIGPIFTESPCWPCGLYLKSFLIFTRHFDLEFSIFEILKIYNLNIKFKNFKNIKIFLKFKIC
jgi:hypothetical protein